MGLSRRQLAGCGTPSAGRSFSYQQRISGLLPRAGLAQNAIQRCHQSFLANQSCAYDFLIKLNDGLALRISLFDAVSMAARYLIRAGCYRWQLIASLIFMYLAMPLQGQLCCSPFRRTPHADGHRQHGNRQKKTCRIGEIGRAARKADKQAQDIKKSIAGRKTQPRVQQWPLCNVVHYLGQKKQQHEPDEQGQNLHVG